MSTAAGFRLTLKTSAPPTSKSRNWYLDMSVSDCGIVQDACTVDPVCTNVKLSTMGGTREDNDGLIVGGGVGLDEGTYDGIFIAVGSCVGDVEGRDEGA